MLPSTNARNRTNYDNNHLFSKHPSPITPSPFFPIQTLPHRRRKAFFQSLPYLFLLGLLILPQFQEPKQELQNNGDKSKSLLRLFKNSNDNEQNEQNDDHYNGRYPESLITLFYPYTLLSDVVLSQPIPESDIPFFWHIHGSDERILKKIFTGCFQLQLVELNDLESIKRAREVNLVKGLNRRTHVVTSPFLRETAEIFTTEHFARTLCFFRHPLDYDLHPNLPTFPRKDNWMVRYLSDEHEMEELTFKQLGVAKHVVRECCLVGTLDKMMGSILRMKVHMDWSYHDDFGGDDERGEQCIREALVDSPEDTYIDHESEEWHEHYKMNRFDCLTYEVAQSAWRAQIQTIIPWELQLSREALRLKEEEEKKKKAEEKKKKKAEEEAKKQKKTNGKKFCLFCK